VRRGRRRFGFPAVRSQLCEESVGKNGILTRKRQGEQSTSDHEISRRNALQNNGLIESSGFLANSSGKNVNGERVVQVTADSMTRTAGGSGA
jgi:hypothetical protein